jgi:hypothetical protein
MQKCLLSYSENGLCDVLCELKKNMQNKCVCQLNFPKYVCMVGGSDNFSAVESEEVVNHKEAKASEWNFPMLHWTQQL